MSALLCFSISKYLSSANLDLKAELSYATSFPLPFNFWLNFRVKTVYPALLKWMSLQVDSTCQIFTVLISLFQLEFSVLCTYKYLFYCQHLSVDLWFLCNLKIKTFWVCFRITPTLKTQLSALISGDLEFHWIILLLSFLLSAIPDFYCINFHCVLHSNAFFQESRNYSCVDFNTIGSSF